MSKLVEKYKRSPFANIGAKVSNLKASEPKIPFDSNKLQFDGGKDILQLQSDFINVIVKPYKTIFESNTNFGNIIVNPTKSILDFFDKINTPSPIILSASNESKLLKLNSIYDNIKSIPIFIESKTLLRNLPILNEIGTSTVLNSNISNIKLSIQKDLLKSPMPDIISFEGGNILDLNSSFDDVVDMKISSVLDRKSNFGDIINLPYSDVLNSKINSTDLIIKDISSVLSVYVASKLPSTIPGVVNFFDDVYNTGFTLNARFGDSLFNFNKVPNYRDMKQNPEKEIIDIKGANSIPEKIGIDPIPMKEISDKPIINIKESPLTPEKTGIDIVPMKEISDKPIIDIKLSNDTPEKTGIDIVPMKEISDKPTIDIKLASDTPEKTGIDIVPMKEISDKPIIDIKLSNDIPEKTGIDIVPMKESIQKTGIDPVPMKEISDKPTIDIKEPNPPSEFKTVALIPMRETSEKEISVEAVPMKESPEKSGIELIPMDSPSEKTGIDIIPMQDTPEKNIIDIVPMQDTPSKNIAKIVPMAETPEKGIVDIIPMAETPEKGIVDIISMPETPEKGVIDIIPMPETPQKGVVDIIPMPATPDKGIIDIVPMREPIEKPISDINPPAKTLEKPISKLIPIEDTPEKPTINIIPIGQPSEKLTANIIPMGTTPEKKVGNIIPMGDTPDKNIQELRDINPTPEKTTAELREVDFIKTDDATGFTSSRTSLPQVTEFNLNKIPNLFGYNWNDPAAAGVLNQFAVYFARKGKVTDLTYKQILDWAVRTLVYNPEAEGVYQRGFSIPKIPVNQIQLITPPYTHPDERLPSWAKSYVTTLEDMGTSIISGIATQASIDIASTVLGVDMSGLKKSPIIFHQLAGEVYWKHRELGNVVRNARESAIIIASNVMGEQLARQIIPKVESIISSIPAWGLTRLGVPSDTANLIANSDKILMIYHILMGTKYTKSKAFHDRNVSRYSSTWKYTGDTAVNFFDDKNLYKDYVGPNQKSNRDDIPESISTLLLSAKDPDSSTIYKSLILSRYINISNASSDTYIPTNFEINLLDNPYIKKSDSKTFQGIEKFYSENQPLTEVTALSVEYNYNPLVKAPIQRQPGTLSETLRLPNQIPTNEDIKYETYIEKLTNKISGQKKLLSEKGLLKYDTKNELGLLKTSKKTDLTSQVISADFEDDDLINFYFEDLSTLSINNETIVIPFRAIITSLGNNTSANWSPQDYMGRADKFWIYQGFERRISLSFEVAINSFEEFESSWKKINYLEGMCYPVEYPNAITLKAPIMALTIGNLFNRIQVILNSISVTFDGSSIWEIKKNYQLPMHIKIATDFTVLFADIPRTNARHYAQNQKWIDANASTYNAEQLSKSDGDLLVFKNNEKDGSVSIVNSQIIPNNNLPIGPNVPVTNT